MAFVTEYLNQYQMQKYATVFKEHNTCQHRGFGTCFTKNSIIRLEHIKGLMEILK